MKIWRNVAVATAMMTMAAAPALAQDMRPSGTISIDETQFGFLIGGNIGGGKLRYAGRTHDFKVGGISIGDIGVSKVKGSGTVYNLARLSDFPGTYSKVDASATAGVGKGVLRLRNGNGVVLEIASESKGLQLSAGAGGVEITLK